MQCPYCNSPVTQVQTGNTPGSNELVVCEDNESFDGDISMFQCTFNKTHIFYCDDNAGNKIKGLPEYDL